MTPCIDHRRWLTLAETDTRAAVVLVDELDAG
jgi:hypothetical protein